MDTFHRVEFTGTWRRLFSRVKKHIIWGVLKSVTGMQVIVTSNASFQDLHWVQLNLYLFSPCIWDDWFTYSGTQYMIYICYNVNNNLLLLLLTIQCFHFSLTYLLNCPSYRERSLKIKHRVRKKWVALLFPILILILVIVMEVRLESPIHIHLNGPLTGPVMGLSPP